MFSEVKPENVGEYLKNIDLFFPDFRTGGTVSQEDINRYYQESFWGYKLFHSWAGAIHMALSDNGKVSKNDYFGQARRAEDLIIQNGWENGTILEVGCGAGFNVCYLSSRFPNARFVGIDISERNVSAAKELCKRRQNCEVLLADFHELSQFEDEHFDLVFAVETICHALDLGKVLLEMNRILKPNGIFLVFDGYRNGFENLDEQLKKAVEYTERAMAVPRFLAHDEFLEAAEKVHFHHESSENLSEQIMPNLVRLSDRAKAFFRLKPLAKLMKAALPAGLVTNAIAGLLMSVTVTVDAHRYHKTIFKK